MSHRNPFDAPKQKPSKKQGGAFSSSLSREISEYIDKGPSAAEEVPAKPEPESAKEASREVDDLPSSTWVLAGYLFLLLLLALSGYSLWQMKLKNDQLGLQLTSNRESIQQKEDVVATLNVDIRELREEKTVLETQIDELQSTVASLRDEKDQVTQAQQQLEKDMRARLQSKDVTISELQGKLTLNILDRILFDSGAAEIKPEGQEVLTQIAGVLAEFPNRQIHVIGHTDNIPIRTAQFPSNWELSAARATAAVRFLSEAAGVDPRRLAAVGYGEFHPVADNATMEGRAQNRRIAIVVLPETFDPSKAELETVPETAATEFPESLIENTEPSEAEKTNQADSIAARQNGQQEATDSKSDSDGL